MSSSRDAIFVNESPSIYKFWKTIEAGETLTHSYVQLLGFKTFDTAPLLKKVHVGFSFDAWENFAKNTALAKEDIFELVQISARTIARRRDEGRLHPDESDRLLRATKIFAQALSLFEGDASLARQWLLSPQVALGGSTPLKYASTELGAREVENLIGRLEHGIPS